MKSQYLKIALLFLFIPSLGFAQEGTFTLTGKLNKSFNDSLMTLVYLQGKNVIKNDVITRKGTFTVSNSLEAPTLATLKKGKDSISVFISKGQIMLNIKDSLKYAQISGTKLAEDHVELSNKLHPVNLAMAALAARFRALPKDEQKANTMEFITEVKANYMKKTNIIYDFLAQHPDSYVSLYYLLKVTPTKPNYETTMPHFEKLSKDLQQSPLGMELYQKLSKVKGEMNGQKYKTFESTTPEGKKLSLDEVLAKGKYTLVDFWASWCGPCRNENPNVVAAYKNYHDKGFNIISVSLDNDAAKWKEAIAKDGMPWYHVSSLMGWKEPVAQLYGVRAIPQNLLIDKNGIVVATNLREEALLNKLKTLMN